MATTSFMSGPALAAPTGPAAQPAAQPTVSLTESCGPAFGVAATLTGFPPSTPFLVSLTFNSFAITNLAFTTDSEGSFSDSIGSAVPMGLVTLTVQAIGRTFVATLQDPCEGTGPDTIPPVIVVPPTMTLDATTPAGAVVDYTVAVRDNRLPTPPANCVPPSGSTFRAGTTVVRCTATDRAGNTGTASFRVVVHSAADQLRRLRATVVSSDLPAGLTRALTAKLDAATRSAEAGRLKAACRQTRAFAKQLVAQSGKAVAAGTATLLALKVLRIRPALGCASLSLPLTMPVLVLEPACDLTHVDVGSGGRFGATVTLEGFPPGVTVTTVFFSSAVDSSLSDNVVTDASGRAGPIDAAVSFPIGTLTVTASVDGIQLATASLQNPCDP
jgi:hypothetical protein